MIIEGSDGATNYFRLDLSRPFRLTSGGGRRGQGIGSFRAGVDQDSRGHTFKEC